MTTRWDQNVIHKSVTVNLNMDLILLFLIITLIYLVPTASSSSLNVEGLEKLRLKEIRSKLKERGALCEGCTEKEHFLDRLKEVFDWPILDQEQKHTPNRSAKKTEKLDEVPDFSSLPPDLRDSLVQKFKQEEELKNKLNAAGINTDGMDFGQNSFGNMFKKKKDKDF